MAEASTTWRMPWKASSVMEEKVRFVVDYERDEQTMTELCRQRHQNQKAAQWAASS
jgi:hypothetical protein